MNKCKMIKIGNAQGFWGDSRSAPALLMKQQPDLHYLTLDYLSEVSLSIMAIQKEKDVNKGYAQDFLEVIKSLIPFWKNGSQLKIIAKAGGLNPQACAEACQVILQKENSPGLKIGIVSGDSVLERMQRDHENLLFRNLDMGQSLEAVLPHLVTANAYLGAKPICEALRNHADIVITGRVADPSLTVGPCMAEFDWIEQDYDRLAGATLAGHLIECGTQVTGGISSHWLEIKNPAEIGFPVVEMSSDGTFIITKPIDSGGRVTIETVKEQLLYEITDPENYLSPDVTVSFLGIQILPEGQNRLKILGAKGKKPPPDTFKVSATYQDGYKVEANLAIFGQDAGEKARRCGKIIVERVKRRGFDLSRVHIECLGSGDVVPGVFQNRSQNLLECVLRIAAADPRKEALECLANEIAPLVTSGPQGTTGYISGKPPIRQVFGYWPCLIPTFQVAPLITYIN